LRAAASALAAMRIKVRELRKGFHVDTRCLRKGAPSYHNLRTRKNGAEVVRSAAKKDVHFASWACAEAITSCGQPTKHCALCVASPQSVVGFI